MIKEIVSELKKTKWPTFMELIKLTDIYCNFVWYNSIRNYWIRSYILGFCLNSEYLNVNIIKMAKKEVKKKSSNPKAKWYVLNIRTGYENSIKKELEQKIEASGLGR